ncbi:hypothetical protein psyc5s11_10410 [Clostridium gelidum]|uniref:XkdX family protein n=1 Tax=Clostridium gelidum TaxID=704125 RepID=A0ABN6ISK5_9CLOT|nr:hypothetical protein [Clostridium gelidum]BCZ44974.1 hypothetical protein psyc5s11_10410 [Clostridium gelidum]
MKEFFKELFSSNNMKKAVISMLLSNGNLTVREYQRLSNDIRAIENYDKNKVKAQVKNKVEIKKAS